MVETHDAATPPLPARLLSWGQAGPSTGRRAPL